MLTKSDLQQIGKLVKAILNAELFDMREDIKDMKNRLKHLPNKDEYFTKMDKVITELQKERDEHTVMRGQIEDHDNRIEKVEKKLRITSPN